MNKGINKTLNNRGLSVSTGEYKGYNLNFNLEFVDGGDAIQMEKSQKNDPIGNSFSKTGSNAVFPKTITNNTDGITTESYAGGITVGSNKILMNDNADTKSNKIHEIFHTFGLDDAHKGGPKNGKMEYPPKKANQNDANEIVNNGLLKVKEDEE